MSLKAAKTRQGHHGPLNTNNHAPHTASIQPTCMHACNGPPKHMLFVKQAGSDVSNNHLQGAAGPTAHCQGGNAAERGAAHRKARLPRAAAQGMRLQHICQPLPARRQHTPISCNTFICHAGFISFI